MSLRQRRIYADDFELLHEGMKRLAKVNHWEVIDRPLEPAEEVPPDPRLVTLESLGLAHLRPVPEPVAELAEVEAEDTQTNLEVAGEADEGTPIATEGLEALDALAALEGDEEDDDEEDDDEEDDGEEDDGEEDDGEEDDGKTDDGEETEN